VPTVTEAIVERLARAGVRHIYGVPGGECNLDFIAAARRLGVRFVLTRNETAAAIMASVTAELTGTLGVAMTTRGPGLAAAANGVAYACLDRAPLLLIADGYEDDQGFISHQRIDQAALLRPMTKAESTLGADDPLADLERLIQIATAIPPGPVYLEVSGSRIRREAPPTESVSTQHSSREADAAAIEAAKALLAKARRPLILAGLQARRPAAAEALRAVVKQTGCPVLTTYKAKGVVSEHDPLTLGHYMGGVAEEPLIRSADLLLLYGFDPVEGPPQKWRYADIATVELTEHSYDHPLIRPAATVVGEIAALLPRIAGTLDAGGWPADQLADAQRHLSSAARVPAGEGVSPVEVVDAAAATAPADCRITIDAGAHMLPVLHLWRSDEPSQSLISRGLSTMGFALPAAIASCLADPGRRAIAFTGDGGLMMCLGELGTAAQEGLAPVVVVFNDACLTLIADKQRRRQLAADGIDFSGTDFAEVARGFGWDACRVTQAADLQPAIAEALACGGPALVDVVVDPHQYHEMILALRG
jgi:acetolactate synthase-1/2/3 large subunit